MMFRGLIVMKMKNRKGSTLIMTLLVFVVFMIFGTLILSFMVSENKMSLNHQYKTQAYYLARSGAVAVEAAIMDMNEKDGDEDEDDRKKLLDLIPEIINNDKGLKIDVDGLDLEEDKEALEVYLWKDKDDNIRIKSKGRVNNIEQTVEKVIGFEKNNEGTTIQIGMAVHSEGEINIEKGKIIGDVTSNKGPIIVNKNNGKITGGNKILNPSKEYPLPVFPEKNEVTDFIKSIQIFPPFPKYKPSVQKNENLDFSYPINEITINSHKQYESIEIPYSKTLIIDAQKH